MPDRAFRITVEDLETGEKQAMELASGDYILIPFAPCYLETTQTHANGTHVITVKNHRPTAKPIEVTPHA
jgi:hypothetical protein